MTVTRVNDHVTKVIGYSSRLSLREENRKFLRRMRFEGIRHVEKSMLYAYDVTISENCHLCPIDFHVYFTFVNIMNIVNTRNISKFD